MDYLGKLSVAEFSGAVFGFVTMAVINVTQRKPPVTGIYKHFALGGVCFWLGGKFEQYSQAKGREKMIMIEDYICQHPEDFPNETPKTYGDVVLRWFPVR